MSTPDDLYDAILDGRRGDVAGLVQGALDEGVAPMTIVEETLQNLGSEEVNTRWREYMKDFFEAASRGTGRADENMIVLQEVFHLD